MTDTEIKKALEVCAYLEACADCPFGDIEGVDKCMHSMMQDALDLINRQQADNERLKKLLEEADVNYDKCAKRFYTEAIKEFAERVKMAFYYEFDEIIPSIMADKIDNLVKEMVGDAE